MAIKINGVTVIDDSRNGTLVTSTATGNVVGGNVTTGGLISAAGNITGNYILGNGSQLTGIDATSIQSGTSNVRVVSSGGNVTVGVGGTSNVAVFYTGGMTVGGFTLSGNTLSSAGTTLTIDPSSAGQEGNVVIAGNLSVQGNVTYIDSTTITTNEKDIVLANNVNTQSAVNGAGLLLGNNSVVTLTYNSTSNAWTSNVGFSAAGNIVGANVSGTLLAGTLSTAAQPNVTSVGTLTSLSVTGNVDAGNLRTAGVLSVNSGNISGTVIVNAGGNGVGNIGSATGYFNTIHAKATSAQYADLAEMYEADQMIQPGTVVCFGGAKEVKVADEDASRRIAGVVSTNPSYIMNAGLSGDHVVAVALTGRVPTRVTGSIQKGDMLVSTADGRAQAAADPAVGSVIGKALADFEGADGVIEVVVGRL